VTVAIKFKKRRGSKLATLTTSRLILRQLRASDAADVFEYASDSEVTKFVRFVTHKSIKDTRAFLAASEKSRRKGATMVWAVTLKSSGKVIGSCGFVAMAPAHSRAELGYAINRKYWDQGYATEAARALVAHGFRGLNLNRIEAHVSPQHIPSQRVLEKSGFTAEGILRQHEWIKGHWHDSKIYSILRADFDLCR
jgi:ribosomal-protein-alanine N-acetyltransferase